MILVGIIKDGEKIDYKVNRNNDKIVYKSIFMPIMFIETSTPEIYLKMEEFENIYEERIGNLQSMPNVNFIPSISIDRMRKAGFMAWGTNVAIIDSGINKEVKPIDSIDFTGENNVTDFVNHGTIVASIIKNVAGGVGLINLKITDSDKFREMYLMKALDYIYSEKDKISIINMSLGLKNDCQGKNCAICKTINFLANEGIICIAAAGNDGPNNNTVTCPAISEEVLAVGAVAANGKQVASYSGRGKRNRCKPDLLAPGSVNGELECKNEPFGEKGTSFSAPIISGIAAILVAKYRENEYVIEKIKDSTNKLEKVPEYCQGKGVIDIDKVMEVLKDDASYTSSKQQC